MDNIELTAKEKTVLYGLIHYPTFTDKQLSDTLYIKQSTTTAIRHRLRQQKYYKTLCIPRLQSLGCNMLVVIYSHFNPLIPLDERIKITGKTIEVFDEIFFSVGEQDKGFSLSISQDYATIGRINDIRTQTFGGRGLLENEYPNMVVFPFEISKIYRFFDFAPLLNKRFNLEIKKEITSSDIEFQNREKYFLSSSEKKVFCFLVKYPELSDTEIGSKLNVSRHTVSRLRRGFEQKNLIRKINLPDFKQLGFEILTFHHINFDPSNPPNMELDDSIQLMGDSTIYLSSRRFEAVMLSIYANYEDYNKDSTRIMQVLKEHNWIAENPIIRTYSLSQLVFIKEFAFAPIAKKIVGCTIDV